MERRHSMKRLLLGVVILIIGSGLLLSNLGFLENEFKDYFFRWELIFIILGLGGLMHRDKKGAGVIMLIIGSVFYLKFLHIRGVLPDFIDFNFNFWQLFWPAILILAGVLIIFKRSVECKHHSNDLSDDDLIDELAVFGGGDRILNSQNFKGGKVTAIFGGSNFNLTRAKLAKGKNIIDIFAVFGGLKLVVPEDWNIKIKVVSIFGGFSDKHRIHTPDENSDNNSELIIKGFVLFGGGEIKSF